MQIKPNYITIFSFFLSMSIGSCNCKKDPADGDKNKIHSSNPPTSNPPTSNPPATNPAASNPPASNPPISNPPTPPTSAPTSNATSISSSSSADDSSDSEEDAKNTPLPSTPLPTLQNPPTSVNNNNKPADNSSAMPITDEMIQISNSISNPTSTPSAGSTDDSIDSEEDAKSKSTPLPPLQNPPTSVNNNKPADNSSVMPITDEMIQISNSISNLTSPPSSGSTDDSIDSEEDAKSKSTPLPPLQNPPTSVNNNKPADNSSVMPITDEMIQISNSISNLTSPPSSDSTDDSIDSEEDAKSKSTPLPPLQNLSTSVNNNKPADNSNAMPITGEMIQISNSISNPTSIPSSTSTGDSSDSEEDAKSKSTPLSPLQNLPTSMNNNKPADNSSAMPITDEMIQTLRSSGGSDEGKRANRRAFADRLEGIKNGTVQVGTANDLYTLFDGSKCHLIFAAIMTDRVDILEALVESGASVVPVTSKGENALNAACRYGKLEAVKFLFTVERLKSFIWTRSVYGRNTNLMAAVKSKNLAVVEYVWNETLRQPGGKLFFEADKQADINGTTPLLQAKADGSQPIVDFLVSKGFKEIY